MRSKEEEDRSHLRAAGVVGAEDDAVVFITDAVQHCIALLPELHGHDPPLHRHPFTVGTYGERPTLPCLPPDFATLAMALNTVSV